MKITIKEVAKEAGVSIATVSRVLNGKDGIKPATKDRVEKAIMKYNFSPDQIARSMIVKESKTIGLLVPQLSNEYWATLAEVVEEALWMQGYTLLLCTSSTREDSLQKEKAAIHSFIQRKVDGIIYSTSSGLNASFQAFTEQIKQYGLPIIAFDQKIQGMSQIYGDHLQGAMDAVKHLIQLGHRDIAYIGGPLVSPERELGYRNAHTIHGLAVDEELIIRGEPSFQFGSRAVRRLLAAGKRFTGLFCGNDLIALGALQALEAEGWRVPEDVAVVGYDDIHMAGLARPALTTVRQPVEEMGRTIVERLLQAIETGNAPQQNCHLVFPMTLVVRDSCGARALHSQPVADDPIDKRRDDP
ncbi:LacI family DNA-binding transcriptional regulator [Paenibacillus sp.]|uniref:LacI family DNA-binding transcriptional regulator n=1 Tax=Paenibacillus sp. TaxID=58172 RepID=UPI002D332DE9|nr:LacI family DNA-binding transcriptional regulator [Paenibacillus sp.]HZG88157.1 LacI family DNA-binding transcriptional regulator [Paenibacillus sp.]